MADNTNETMVKATEIIEKEEKVSLGKKIVNGAKSVGKKVKTTMSEHPIATFVAGTVAGVAGTVAAGVAVNKIANRNSNVDDYDESDISDDDLNNIENVEDDTNVDI